MQTSKQVLLMFLAAIFLSGCNQEPVSAEPAIVINQDSLCEVTDWRYDAVAKICTSGQKVVFLPSRFGNEQLPILFAAVNCDLRFSVALTNGAVTCIYKPITPN